MHLVRSCSLVALSLACSTAWAQPTRTPPRAPPDLAQRVARMSRHLRVDRLSPATKALVARGGLGAAGRLPSIPTFSGSFTSGGVAYPYVMAGGNPRRGGETDLATSYVSLSFVFDEFVDAAGNNIFFDAQAILPAVLGSPSFEPTRYSVGTGQFGDVVQRASFYSTMGPGWHTTLQLPRVLTPVTIEVPPGLGQVFDATGNGDLVALVDDGFFESQLNTILQLEDIRTDELPIFISSNVFINSALGFHGAYDVSVRGRPGIQTFLWSSWLDEVLFGPIFADATTLTHEVSEWIADPFVNNLTPEYAIPNSGTPPFCQSLLEVGDAIEFLDSQMFPVVVRGRTYHTQNEALLSWFSRESPSSGFQHAYSYPDTTVLTAPSPACPPDGIR